MFLRKYDLRKLRKSGEKFVQKLEKIFLQEEEKKSFLKRKLS